MTLNEELEERDLDICETKAALQDRLRQAFTEEAFAPVTFLFETDFGRLLSSLERKLEENKSALTTLENKKTISHL